MKVKVIKIDPTQQISPFDNPKIKDEDYIGQIGKAELVSLSEDYFEDSKEEKDLFLVTFEDGKVGSFLKHELEFIK